MKEWVSVYPEVIYSVVVKTTLDINVRLRSSFTYVANPTSRSQCSYSVIVLKI